jgi:hypothetical protein
MLFLSTLRLMFPVAHCPRLFSLVYQMQLFEKALIELDARWSTAASVARMIALSSTSHPLIFQSKLLPSTFQ